MSDVAASVFQRIEGDAQATHVDWFIDDLGAELLAHFGKIRQLALRATKRELLAQQVPYSVGETLVFSPGLDKTLILQVFWLRLRYSHRQIENMSERDVAKVLFLGEFFGPVALVPATAKLIERHLTNNECIGRQNPSISGVVLFLCDKIDRSVVYEREGWKLSRDGFDYLYSASILAVLDEGRWYSSSNPLVRSLLNQGDDRLQRLHRFALDQSFVCLAGQPPESCAHLTFEQVIVRVAELWMDRRIDDSVCIPLASTNDPISPAH